MQYKEALKLFELESKPTDEELKKQYKKLMRKWHPDISKESNAQEMVYKIDEAYKVLSMGYSEQSAVDMSQYTYKKKVYTHNSIFDVVQC